MCVILISTTYIYWQWRKGKRRDPIAHSVILVWLGRGNAGYGKGDGDGLFLKGNSSGVDCVVILGFIYSALGGSDEWI